MRKLSRMCTRDHSDAALLSQPDGQTNNKHTWQTKADDKTQTKQRHEEENARGVIWIQITFTREKGDIVNVRGDWI